MKHPGSSCEFNPHLESEVMRAFRDVLSGSAPMSVAQLREEVSRRPCARFWVSPRRAAIVLSAMEAGRDALSGMTGNKRAMFAEIYRRYAALRRSDPASPVLALAEAVVTSAAPRFYLTPRTVGEIINRVQRRVRRSRR